MDTLIASGKSDWRALTTTTTNRIIHLSYTGHVNLTSRSLLILNHMRKSFLSDCPTSLSTSRQAQFVACWLPPSTLSFRNDKLRENKDLSCFGEQNDCWVDENHAVALGLLVAKQEKRKSINFKWGLHGPVSLEFWPHFRPKLMRRAVYFVEIIESSIYIRIKFNYYKKFTTHIGLNLFF